MENNRNNKFGERVFVPNVEWVSIWEINRNVNSLCCLNGIPRINIDDGWLTQKCNVDLLSK